MKCRILYLIAQLDCGGQEHQLYELLRSMDRERYLPAVAVWNFKEDDMYLMKIRQLGVPVYRLSAGPAINALVKLLRFRRLIRDTGAELAHSYSFYLNSAVFLATVYTGVIPVGSIRSDLSGNGWWFGKILKYINFRWPAVNICNNRSALKIMQASYKKSILRKSYLVVNGVDLEQFRPAAIPDVKPVIIAGAGSLRPCKRWDLLILAAQELKKQGMDFKIKIAGTGPLLAVLIERIRKLGLEGRIEFVGLVPDMHKFLSEASFLVHTSDTEGTPNIVLEAMASGRAVLASDAGDLPYIVEDGVTGFLIMRNDLQALVRRMVELISNPDLCRKMGDAGRQKAQREFKLERFLEETLTVYRAVNPGFN